MQVFDSRVYEIVEKAMEGKVLTETETCELYSAPETAHRPARTIARAKRELESEVAI